MYSKNDIVTVLSIAGEIVGRYKDETEFDVIIDYPKLFVQTEQGAGFAPGICMTADSGERVNINKSTVLSVLKSNEETTKAWHQVNSGIVI